MESYIWEKLVEDKRCMSCVWNGRKNRFMENYIFADEGFEGQEIKHFVSFNVCMITKKETFRYSWLKISFTFGESIGKAQAAKNF